jgi:hypothetical protein
VSDQAHQAEYRDECSGAARNENTIAQRLGLEAQLDGVFAGRYWNGS